MRNEITDLALLILVLILFVLTGFVINSSAKSLAERTVDNQGEITWAYVKELPSDASADARDS
jgi:hypothetical protein